MRQETSVPGLFAAGDVVRGLNQGAQAARGASVGRPPGKLSAVLQ